MRSAKLQVGRNVTTEDPTTQPASVVIVSQVFDLFFKIV